MAEPEIVYSASGRAQRTRKLPGRYQDPPADPYRRARRDPQPDDYVAMPPQVEIINGVPSTLHKTKPDDYGFYRVTRIYHRQGVQPEQVKLPIAAQRGLPDNIYHPYPNYTAFAFHDFQLSHPNGITNSAMKDLQHIMAHPEFKQEDFLSTNIDKLHKLTGTRDYSTIEEIDSGWRCERVSISVPVGCLGEGLPESINFEIEEFYYRPIIGVLKSIFSSNSDSRNIVYLPYEQRVITVSGADMGVYSEAFCSKRFRDFHDHIQHLPGCDDGLERAVAGMIIHSDSLSPTNFGTTKIWPAYLSLANMSISERTGRNSKGIHHIMHIPEVNYSPLVSAAITELISISYQIGYRMQ